MRLLLPSWRTLLCLFLLSSYTAATYDARRQETTAVADTPSTAPSTSGPTSTDDGQTTTTLPASSASSDTLSSTEFPVSSTTPTPTGDGGSMLFNATLPEDQLPLEPQLTPGWAVSGTILISTGITFALLGIRARRVQTFFSTAFLTALSTTVLILYLMTPPISNAVQGAFVVAAVGTGAALGGLAVLFQELAECLGCLLGGFCLSMWLLTLQPGGLVRNNSAAKIVFIAVFTCAGLALYFSRWTRAYVLVGCIAFAGSTAVVLGIDCFSRAGLKEFWAYIWALNEGLFPEGVISYPLTRGIRVELAIAVIMAVFGVISQLRLWRLVQNRRGRGKEEASDEEVVLPDEEEDIGRRVEETAARERREWDRVYGGRGSVHDGSMDSGVGDMESEKRERHSERTSATSITEIQASVGLPDRELPTEPSGGTQGQNIRLEEEDMVDSAGQEKRDGPLHEILAPTPKRCSDSGEAPPIIPLPFKIPAAPRAQGDQSGISPDVQDDKSSVVAVAFEEDEPPQPSHTDGITRIWRSSVNVRRDLLQQTLDSEVENGDVAESDEERPLPLKASRDDLDSVLAILDDESSSGEADTAALDWPPESPGDSEEGSYEAEEPRTGTDQGNPPPAVPADEARDDRVKSPVLEELDQQAITTPILQNAQEHATETGKTREDKQEEAASARDETPADTDPSLIAPELVGSAGTAARRLTKSNLPSALPNVALAYRTNEWAKHLSIAETPEPEALQLSEHIPEAPDEEPAHLDVVELQQTATNGAPPPAVPKSAMSNHPPLARSTPRASLSGSEVEGFAPTAYYDLQAGHRPGSYRSSMTKHQSLAVLAQPIAEEDVEARSSSGLQRTEATLAARSADTYGPATPQTLIGMREMLLRSRASGIFTSLPSQLDLDDLPLSQRRALIRQSSLPIPVPALVPRPQLTAESSSFNSHQPARNSNVLPEPVRQAQLAQFRHSVAADLRGAAPPPRHGLRRMSLSATTLLTSNSNSNCLAPPSSSRVSLLSTSGFGGAAAATSDGEPNGDVLRSMELQRSILLGQKEVEVRRREAEALDKGRYEREFDQRMRSGVLMGVHRDAMRRLQAGVKA